MNEKLKEFLKDVINRKLKDLKKVNKAWKGKIIL